MPIRSSQFQMELEDTIIPIQGRVNQLKNVSNTMIYIGDRRSENGQVLSTIIISFVLEHVKVSTGVKSTGLLVGFVCCRSRGQYSRSPGPYEANLCMIDEKLLQSSLHYSKNQTQ